MNWILLGLFGSSSLILICARLRQRSGVLQFPFLAGGGILGFLVIQAVGVTSNGAVPVTGLSKTLFMCVLCNCALFLGWYQRVPGHWRRPGEWVYPFKTLYWAAIACLLLGGFGQLRLLALGGGLVNTL